MIIMNLVHAVYIKDDYRFQGFNIILHFIIKPLETNYTKSTSTENQHRFIIRQEDA